jgi:hypothetical protein
VIFKFHKTLRHEASSITSDLKEAVLRIFMVLKNVSPWPVLNPRPLGSVASTLTVTPSRRVTDDANDKFGNRPPAKQIIIDGLSAGTVA